jgi:hypothetical protein
MQICMEMSLFELNVLQVTAIVWTQNMPGQVVSCQSEAVWHIAQQLPVESV